MKTFLLVFLSLCFAVGIVAFAQDPPNSTPQNQAAGMRRTSILGTVRENGEKLTFVTDQRAWNVDNPETLNWPWCKSGFWNEKDCVMHRDDS
jgi:hypothetical protein